MAFLELEWSKKCQCQPLIQQISARQPEFGWLFKDHLNQRGNAVDP